MNKVEIIGIIIVVIVIALFAFVVFYSPKATLPHCSADVLTQREMDRENSLKGIHSYRVVADCLELHQ